MKNLLWTEDEVKVSDGFLFIVQPKAFSLNENQPLLLDTTLRLLRALYPSLSIEEILPRSGYESEGESEDHHDETVSTNEDVYPEESKPISLVEENYKMYQNLCLVSDLSNRINLALKDIRNFRANASDFKIGKINEKDRDDQIEQNSKSEVYNAANGIDSLTFQEEPIIIKLIQTINSIRALFPHLLPILNHKRWDDKKLVIGKTRYKTKRNGPMCWLLGMEVFGSCTLKQMNTAQDDVKNILESFIDIEVAFNISKDPNGNQSFWPDSWIEHLVKRSNPTLHSPVKILAGKSGINEKTIRQIACDCDYLLSLRERDSDKGLDQQYKRAVRKVHQRLSNVLISRFQGARLSIYGSCLSNLSLGKDSDIDLSLWIPAADNLKKGFEDGSIESRQYEQSMKKLVYQVFRKLSNLKAEFRGLTPITKARIPVITGTYIYAGNPYTEDGSINFDICFMNDIAVANSNLLRDYSLVDHRVRSLMIAVKQWTKEYKINSAKEKCISSYSWMNLVVFYLQCIGFLPNLQSPVLMKAAGLMPDNESNYWHCVNNLNTCTLKWDEVRKRELWEIPSELDDLPSSLLLYGFFEFYSLRFPYGTHAVSIKRGNISLSKLSTRKINAFLSIEDPFETYDSHCPHDLGTPANAYGSTKIRNCLRDAEEHLRMVLCSTKTHEGRLWPEPPFVEPEPSRNNSRKSSFKRFERPISFANNNCDYINVAQDSPATHTTKSNKSNHNRQKRYQQSQMSKRRGMRKAQNEKDKAKKVSNRC